MTPSPPEARPRLIPERAEIEQALETLRDCGDRPGMYEDGERALVAFGKLEEGFVAQEVELRELQETLREACELLTPHDGSYPSKRAVGRATQTLLVALAASSEEPGA